MFKRLNKAREIKRINLNKLKHVYILKFTDNQIHFIKKEAILNFVKNNNYYVKIRNNFVFVNNKITSAKRCKRYKLFGYDIHFAKKVWRFYFINKI